MPQPPELTAESRRAGIEHSLELRRRRAELRAYLSQSAMPVDDLKHYWPFGETQGMQIFRLLTALPGIGKARALSLLDAAGISVKTTVRACGPKQRERLFALLDK